MNKYVPVNFPADVTLCMLFCYNNYTVYKFQDFVMYMSQSYPLLKFTVFNLVILNKKNFFDVFFFFLLFFSVNYLCRYSFVYS